MKFFISISFCILFHSSVFTQDKTLFDQLTYNTPADWNVADNGSYKTYSIINNTANTFCIISIYNSTVSSGNATEDFKNQWKGIIVAHFTVIKNLKPQQNKTLNGISYLQDEANVVNDKGSFFARLLVFNVNGKVQPVLFLSGNKNSLSQYQPSIDQFISSLKQNTSEALTTSIQKDTTSTNQIINTSITAMNNSGLTHFNHFIFKIPPGWKSVPNGNFYMFLPPDLEPDEMLT